jgi:hypothetical protein
VSVTGVRIAAAFGAVDLIDESHEASRLYQIVMVACQPGIFVTAIVLSGSPDGGAILQTSIFFIHRWANCICPSEQGESGFRSSRIWLRSCGYDMLGALMQKPTARFCGRALGETIHIEQNTMVDRTGQADRDFLFHSAEKHDRRPQLGRVGKGALRAVPTGRANSLLSRSVSVGPRSLPLGEFARPVGLAHPSLLTGTHSTQKPAAHCRETGS